MYQAPPRIARVFVLLVSDVVLVSALVLAAASLLATVRPTWMLFGFEVVTVLASLLGIQAGRGRFREGPGLALASIGGTIAVASFLGWVSIRGELPLKNSSISMNAWLAGRVAAGALLAMVGALSVLGRDRRSWGYLLRAGIAALPLGVLGAAAVLYRGRLVDLISGLPGILGVVTWAVLGVVCAVALCAAAHCTIRAFECGRTQG